MNDAVFQQIDSDFDAAVERLKALLAIPSVSTDAAYKAEIQRGAEWVAGQLRELGLEVSIRPTAGHPAVVAHAPAEIVANPAAPRALFYGHYDVQPPDPVEKWMTPPFEPAVRDGKLFARGSSDDKGQVMCFIEALRAWRTSKHNGSTGGATGGGKLPGPVTVLIEGEEEIGSVNLGAFIEEHKADLAADVVLVSDTGFWDTSAGPVPAITYGLRGLLYFDIQLHGPSRDLHSGLYGGTIANPCTILTRIVGSLFDPATHRVVIPGYYDDVIKPTDAERATWDALDFHEAGYLKSIGMSEPYGEAGYSTLERRWCRPACDVNGVYGGYMGKGAKTVIPTFAGAKVSFRLAANQDPNRIRDAFIDWLHAQPTHGLTWQIEQHGQADPVAVSTNSPFMAAAKRAIHAGAGREPVLVREGATIPVIADFKTRLGVDSLLMGFGRSDDAIHSPNEKFELSHFKMGIRSHAAMLAELGGMQK